MSEQHNVPPKIQKNTVPPISPVVDGQETVHSTGYTVSVIQCTGPGVVGGHV